jgi:segregation and condensation protein B
MPTDRPDDDGELTLDALSAAYAEALGRLDQPPAATAAVPVASTVDDSADEVTPLSLLEALLFVGDPSGQPLTCERLAGLMRGVEPHEIHDLARELDRRYAEAGRALTVVADGSGYRLTVRAEYRALGDRLHGRARQVRLSQAALDVLALVAYKQPVTVDEVNRLRGTASGAVVSQLVRRQLLRLQRPTADPWHPVYCTTQRFLELFGLGNLEELPTSRDVETR